MIASEVKKALREYLSIQRWDAFFTATHEPLQEDYTTMSTGQRMLLRPRMRHSATSIKVVREALTQPRLRPVKAFIAAEQNYLGGWHNHGLLELPRYDDGTLRHESEILKLVHNRLSRLGFNKVDIVSDVNAASVYLSKYLIKDEFHGDWLTTGRRKFWQGGFPGVY